MVTKTMRCTNCGKVFELATGKNYCPECGGVLWSVRFVSRTGRKYLK